MARSRMRLRLQSDKPVLLLLLLLLRNAVRLLRRRLRWQPLLRLLMENAA